MRLEKKSKRLRARLALARNRRFISRRSIARERRLRTRFELRDARFKERARRPASAPNVRSDALDVLTDAVAVAPSFAPSFATLRAASFTRRRRRARNAVARDDERRVARAQRRGEARRARRRRVQTRDASSGTRSARPPVEVASSSARARRANKSGRARERARASSPRTVRTASRSLEVLPEPRMTALRAPLFVGAVSRSPSRRAFVAERAVRLASFAPSTSRSRSRVFTTSVTSPRYQSTSPASSVASRRSAFRARTITRSRAATSDAFVSSRAPLRSERSFVPSSRVVRLRASAPALATSPRRESNGSARRALDRRALAFAPLGVARRFARRSSARFLVARDPHTERSASLRAGDALARSFVARRLPRAPSQASEPPERATTYDSELVPARDAYAIGSFDSFASFVAPSARYLPRSSFTGVLATAPSRSRASSSSAPFAPVARFAEARAFDSPVAVRAPSLTPPRAPTLTPSLAPPFVASLAPSLAALSPFARISFARTFARSEASPPRRLTFARAPSRVARRFVEPEFTLDSLRARDSERSESRAPVGLNASFASFGSSSAFGAPRILESIESLLRDSRDSLAAMTRAASGELTLVTGASNR